MIKTGNRIDFVFENKTVRGTVLYSSEYHVTVVGDDAKIYDLERGTDEWNSIEKITVFRAHSIAYLRSLPKELRPRMT